MAAELSSPGAGLLCPEALQLLAVRLDGELDSDSEESAALDAHLGGCPDCAGQERDLAAIKALVKRTAAVPARPELRAAVLVALSREEQEGRQEQEELAEDRRRAARAAGPVWSERRRLAASVARLAAGLAAAAAVGVVGGLASQRAGQVARSEAGGAEQAPVVFGQSSEASLVPVPRLRSRPDPRLSPPLGSALLGPGVAGGLSPDEAYFASVGARPHPLLEDGVALHGGRLPLDLATSDLSRLQRWLSNHLDYGVRLPRFGGTRAEPPPALLGARLWTARSRPAAMVAYGLPDSGGRRVSLLIVDGASDDATAGLVGRQQHVEGHEVFLSQTRGYTVAAWHHGEVVYSLVSDLDERDTLRLVARAQRIR